MKSLALSPTQLPSRGLSVTLPGRGLNEKLRPLKQSQGQLLSQLCPVLQLCPKDHGGSIPEDQSLV